MYRNCKKNIDHFCVAIRFQGFIFLKCSAKPLEKCIISLYSKQKSWLSDKHILIIWNAIFCQLYMFICFIYFVERYKHYRFRYKSKSMLQYFNKKWNMVVIEFITRARLFMNLVRYRGLNSIIFETYFWYFYNYLSSTYPQRFWLE